MNRALIGIIIGIFIYLIIIFLFKPWESNRFPYDPILWITTIPCWFTGRYFDKRAIRNEKL